MIKLDNVYVIANPPYHYLGADITESTRTNVDFKEFVTFLPIRDFEVGKNKDLFHYTSDHELVNNDYSAEAGCAMYCSRVHKDKVNNLTVAEYEISTYKDKSLEKYFKALRARKHYAINDNIICEYFQYDPKTCVMINNKDFFNKHLSYSKLDLTYKLNNSIISKLTLQNQLDYGFSLVGIQFRTTIEKQNFVKFIYSTDGFRFMSKVFTAIDTEHPYEYDFGIAFPKVDWTRSWTVKTILKDYGYTQDEINIVMEDLNNFRSI